MLNINSEEATIFGYIVLCSIIILCITNYYFSNSQHLFLFNFIFLSESTVLTFFFSKAPFYYTVWLFPLSIYFLYNSHGSVNFHDENALGGTIFKKELVKIFPGLGVFLFCCIIFYESMAGFSFNSTGVLVFILSIILFGYDRVVARFGREIDFAIVFLSILGLFFFLPAISYKIIYGRIGEPIPINIWDEDFLVYNLLGRPLSNILSLLGYNVISMDKYILFEDNEAGIMRKVGIAKSCAGITSIQVFMSALISYIVAIYRKFDLKALGFIALGLLISYIANLLRMGIIVLSGHYWGLEMMLHVHRYAGWLIFTIWVFLFFILVEKVYKTVDK